MKFIVTTRRPRHPLVALARLRHAGSHRPDDRMQRRQAAHALLRELTQLQHSP